MEKILTFTIYEARFVSETNVSHEVSWQTFPTEQFFLFYKPWPLRDRSKSIGWGGPGQRGGGSSVFESLA